MNHAPWYALELLVLDNVSVNIDRHNVEYDEELLLGHCSMKSHDIVYGFWQPLAVDQVTIFHYMMNDPHFNGRE